MKGIQQTLKIGCLILVFISMVIGYARFVFPFLTEVLQYVFGTPMYWDRAPFLKNLFCVGVGLFLAVITVWGLNNLFSGKTFFQRIAWDRLLILVFCFAMFGTLADEVRELLPNLKGASDEEGLSQPFAAIPLILTVLVGYAMWRKLWPRNRDVWRCPSCGNFNAGQCTECLNPDCERRQRSRDE